MSPRLGCYGDPIAKTPNIDKLAEEGIMFTQAHWRNRPDKDQPFFSVFNIMETHESRVWMNASKPLLVDPQEIELPPYYPDSPVIRNDLAIHYSNIMRMDSIAGTILHQLEEDGLAGNTIIFFYSDHGDGLPRMKRWTYDSGIHVPLIVRFPDHTDAGSVSDQLVSFVDFPATALSLADPHELNNLAYDQSYRDIKNRLSRAPDNWIEMTDDPLTLPETELVKQLWPPDGIQPVTEDVVFKISNGSLILHSPTEGASIAYQVNVAVGGNHWMLYTGPLHSGAVDSLLATAIRIGYKQSSISRYTGTP